MASLTGRTLGRYRLDATLGRGGMAEVYRAMDTKLGRMVAVKVIHQQHATDAQFVERFLREARLVASLEHPSILPIYDFGEEDGLPFLVMPYLSGGTLKDRVGKPFPPALAATYVQQLADALDAAHAAGVLHRDVKPANVLIGKNDRVALADFGIAKMLESITGLTATGMVVGTPIYMAPEQAQGKPAAPAADLYSLGVLAYELFAGVPPFRGDGALSLMHQHVTTEAPALSTKVGGLPPALDTVFGRALAKDPAARPPTCRALADEITAQLPASAVSLSGSAGWERPDEDFRTAPTKIADGTTLIQTPPPALDPRMAPTVIEAPRPGTVDAPPKPPSLTSASTIVARGSAPASRRRMAIAGVAVALGATALLVARRASRTSEAPVQVAIPTPAPVVAARAPTAVPAPAAAPTADLVILERPRATPVAGPKRTVPVPESRVASAADRPAPAATPTVPAVPTPPRIEEHVVEAPAPPPPPPAREEERAAMTLAAARQRVDPFRGGPRATAADYEAALREARRVLANAPLREDARYLAAYAQGGLDYLAHKDDAAKAALSEGLAATRRMPFAHDGRLLTAFLRRSEERGAISGWELALAFGDARGEAEGLLASEIAKSPQDPAPLFGRALLRHMQGKDEAALSDAAGAAGLARGGRGTAAIADFLGETNIRLGRPEEALRWYRAAMDTPNGGKPERAFAAYRAALLLRDDLHRQAEAAELFQKACDGGNAQACLESGGTARPRGLRRRLAR